MHPSGSASSRSLQARLDKHFIACAAAAAAGALGVTEAQATVQYSGLLDQVVNNQTPAGIYIDVNGLSTSVSAAVLPGWDMNLFNVNFSGGGKIVYIYTADAGTRAVGFNAPYGYVSKLGANVTVDAGSGFAEPKPVPNTTYTALPLLVYSGASGNYPVPSPWKGGVTDGFMGFEFVDSGNTYFGWARLNITNRAGGFAITLRDFAYEDQANTAILTGAGIPEPTTAAALGLLALGAAGIRPTRNGRKR